MEYSYSNHSNTNKNNNCSRLSNKSYPSRTIVHAKLEMTEPGDQDEQEADAIANTIAAGGKISRKISGVSGSSGITVSNQMESQLNHLQGGGQAMPTGLRSMMESGFGQDFSHVRLHTDSEAASLSSSIHAKAFTHGSDIYFNQGQFSPNTSEGQKLMAHELTHVVQGGGKVGREDIDYDTCGDLRIPDFASCFETSFPDECIANKRNDFHQDFIDKCTDREGENVTKRDERINDWIITQIDILRNNNNYYKNAVNTFYSKIQEFDESIITFNCSSVKDGILTILGVGEVFFGPKGQAILEVIKGFGGSSEFGKFIDNYKNKTDYIITKEKLNYEDSCITEALVSMYKIFELIVNIDETKHHFNTISSPTQKNYNSVAYLHSLISKNDILKIKINTVDERHWLFFLAERFIEDHLDILYNDSDDNDDLYYDVNEKKMADNGTFNPVKKEHKLINKVLETFFIGDEYPTAKTTNEYKSTVDALKKYNDATRKKLRNRAQQDALKEVIYFDKNEFHYIDKGVNHYYIDWLNNVMDMEKYDSFEKLPKEDREFNSKIYPKLWNKALKESEKRLNIYFDGQQYIQDGIDDFFVDSLNCIIEIEKDLDHRGGDFNSKIYPKLWNKALNESKKRLNIYFDGQQYIQDGIDDFFVDALNEITKLNNKNNEGKKFNESIYLPLYNEALKYDNIYFDGQQYIQDGIDDFFVDALNEITKLNNKDGREFNQNLFSKLHNRLIKGYQYGKDYEVKRNKYVWNGDSFTRQLSFDSIPEPEWLKTLNQIIEVNNINIE